MNDIISAVSVLLVFLTFLLNAIEKEANDFIDKQAPDSTKSLALASFKTGLKKVLFFKVFPITVIFSITFYTLLPVAVKIIKTSKFSYWNFNTLNTLFLFVELGVLGLLSYSLWKLVQLIKKLNE
jgi:hypothetical protein